MPSPGPKVPPPDHPLVKMLAEMLFAWDNRTNPAATSFGTQPDHVKIRYGNLVMTGFKTLKLFYDTAEKDEI